MATARSIRIIGILALAAAGCSENAIGPSSGPVAPAAANRDANPTSDDCGGLPVAPENLRVDLQTPAFADPTEVTNPLFPIGKLDRVILLGSVDGLPLRVETTLLSSTREIALDGEEVETLASQYIAWLDRRIIEVAIDWYGEDGDGAVWYFGEDVFNYEDGIIADTDGTWLAGRDGPVAMIMPAAPEIGNVWRPENSCPLVFEEVTATETGVTVAGPRGPIAGALIVRELHMDGSFEDKTFAPGYGEFSTGSGSNLEAVALAVPTDALEGPVPDQVETMSDGAEVIFKLVQSGRWADAAATAAEMDDAWDSFQATGVPPMLGARMSDALEALHSAIESRNRAESRQASVDVALTSLDFELRHEEREEIDRDLIEVWARQLLIDIQARDRGAIKGDLASIQWIRSRLKNFDSVMDAELRTLGAAAHAGDLDAATTSAARLRETRARHSSYDS